MLAQCTKKRSKLASKTAKAVDELFSMPKYKDDALKIQKYVKYATQAEGPMLWKTPVPWLGAMMALKDWVSYKVSNDC